MSIERPLVAVVDDEESVGKALNRLLRSAALNVATFVSGAEFLKSLENQTPDCVVLDLQMPEVDGFEVQVRLAQTGLHVPVVVMTACDTPEARERAMEGGFAAYLRKPVDGQVLIDAITLAIRSVVP